jgi:hypothetical protein
MKIAKTPKVTKETKFLTFDLETNGLHGQAFAVGAAIIDMNGKIHDEFTARIEIAGEIDEWVNDNVLPAIENIEVTHSTYQAMCDDFWKWFVAAQQKSDYTLVSNGYPVEYRFLLDCQNSDIESRFWGHPFPLIDLSSLLLGFGLLTDKSKPKLASKVANGRNFLNHNPLDDAIKAALIAIEAFKTVS